MRRLLSKYCPYLLRSNYVPNIIANTINDIDFDMCKAKGVTTLVYDLDNTICLPQIYTPDCSILDSYNKSLKLFKVYLLSNSIGKPSTLLNIATKNFKAPLLIHNKRKPFCSEELTDLHKLKSEEVLVIGDRIMTDILFANINGYRSALVLPIMQEEEWHIRIIRHIEHGIAKINIYL